MLNAILEHYPIKKYGTIALLFVFPIVASYYYFAYYPFLETNQTVEVNCGSTIDLSISTPIFVANETEINIVATNESSEDIENIKIIILPDINTQQRITSIKFETVSIDSLRAGSNESKISKLTIYGMQDDSYIRIKDIYVVLNNQTLLCSRVNNPRITYNQLGSWALSVIRNFLVATAVLLFLSAISCLIFEDDNQDFHPTSRLGTYYIVRIFFRASYPLAAFFIALHWITSDLLGIWQINYVPNVVALMVYILVSLAAIKSLTRLIRVKPKTRIIINGSGKEKEVEIIEQSTEFNLREFFAQISKTKKP